MSSDFLNNLLLNHYDLNESKEILKIKLETADKYEEILEKFQIDKLNDDLSNFREEIIPLAIASIQLFVEKNFINPSLEFGIIEKLKTSEFVSKQYDEIKLDSEINENIKYLELLLISEKILEKLNEECSSVFLKLWLIRVLYIHDQCLNNRSLKILTKIESLLKCLDISTNDQIVFDILICNVYYHFSNMVKFEYHLNRVKKLAEIDIDLAGELGKRTKHQIESKAQIRLKLKVLEHSNRKELKNIDLSDNFPENLKLNDEVRLNKIKWDNENYEADQYLLFGYEQSIMLLEMIYAYQVLPDCGFLNEKIMPIIECVLRQKNSWCASVLALYYRCIFENKHKRTVERSMQQMYCLVQHIQQNLNRSIRLTDFWLFSLPPFWVFQKKLADIQCSLGLYKSALDVYIGIEEWEDVINCYQVLNDRNKAIEIIEQELAKKPTIKLLCYLGDLTDDVDCYQKALDQFGLNNFRPYKHWALKLYEQKDYEQSIEHFTKSLDINSLQIELWSKLGFAAMMARNWRVAANAYRRYTHLEPNAFEGWNNLSRVYIAQGDKKRAHAALLESSRLCYDVWQVWDNLMLVSIDLYLFDDVLRAYDRILDLKGRHLDIEVLQKFAANFDQTDQRLLNKFLQLLGHLSGMYPAEYHLWELYGDLSSIENGIQVQRYLRAYRAISQGQSNWTKNIGQCEIVLMLSIKLAKSLLATKDKSLVFSTKIVLNNVVKTIENLANDNFNDNLTVLKELIFKIDTENFN